MRITTWLAALAALGACLCIAAAPPARAKGLEGLAPPGPCAEESDTLRGEPEQGVDPEGFDLAGGPREHFDAQDVGAPGPGPEFAPPEAPTVLRGPCEGPAAGCAEVFAPRGSGVVVTEPPPGSGGGPVFGGGGSGGGRQ